VNELNNVNFNYLKIPRASRAAQNALTGHMWPMGRVFEIPYLDSGV